LKVGNFGTPAEMGWHDMVNGVGLGHVDKAAGQPYLAEPHVALSHLSTLD
jgi:hypothetical protein